MILGSGDKQNSEQNSPHGVVYVLRGKRTSVKTHVRNIHIVCVCMSRGDNDDEVN